VLSVLDLVLLQIRHLLRVPFFVQQAVLAPTSFALLRMLATRGSAEAVTGTLWSDVAVAGLWASTTTAVGLVGHQRRQGTLEHLVVSVHPPGVVFGSLCAAATLLGLAGVPVGWAAQLVASGHVPVVSTTSVMGIGLAVVSCLASSFALSSLFVASRSAVVFEPLVLVPVWLVCGIVVPLGQLPVPLVVVALAHPLTAAVVVAHGTSDPVETVLAVSVALVVSGLWWVVSRSLLSAALRRARVDGTLALS